MRTILFILLLIPSLVSAEALHTRSLEPVVRISGDIIYVTDKKGNDWAVFTECDIKAEDVKRFDIKGDVIKSGRTIRLNDKMKCTIKSIRAA